MTPEEQIQSIIEFYTSNVASGNLIGVGKTSTAKQGKLTAFNNMLMEAQYLIENGYTGKACNLLMAVSAKVDGKPLPPDFVAGSAALELANKINSLIESLNCM